MTVNHSAGYPYEKYITDMHLMNIEAIRAELREGKSELLDRRRKIALLSAIGAIDFTIISLYQMGVIKNLPDFPGEIFDSNKVNASKKAYMMGVPDGTIGLSLYALTMLLASAGGSQRSGRPRWLTYALGGVVLASVGGAIDYLFDMIFKQKKVCMYCLTGAAINFSNLALLVPEMQGIIQSW